MSTLVCCVVVRRREATDRTTTPYEFCTRRSASKQLWSEPFVAMPVRRQPHPCSAAMRRRQRAVWQASVAVLGLVGVAAGCTFVDRVSVSSAGTEQHGIDGVSPPALSRDGRWVAFVSHASDLVPGDTNGSDDVFVHDELTGTTERVSVASDGTQANSDSPGLLSMSADGRLVMFASGATNLAPGVGSDV
jgi:hypothetical protein